MNRFVFLSLFFTTALGLSVPVMASAEVPDEAPLKDKELPEITVTADYRQEKALQTTNSVSVISEQIIKSRAAQHITFFALAIRHYLCCIW